MTTLKQFIKEPLIEKQNIRYQMELDEKVVLYDEWIRKVEKQYDESSSETKIPVICYEECVNGFSLKEVRDEFVIFTSNPSGLSKRANDSIAAVFRNNPDCELIYGDEDEVNSNETIRMNPWFKPDWSPDTLLSFFYFGNVFAVRVSAFRNLIWSKSNDGLFNVYDFCLQAALGKHTSQIVHVKEILFHSHNLQALCLSSAYEDARERANKRMDEQYRDEDALFVSIIVPSKDQPKLLNNLFSSLYARTKNIDFEVIVVDNGSSTENKIQIEILKKSYQFQYLYEKQPFNFAKMCNMGAKQAKGNVLLFLNDDIEIRESDWLFKMAVKARLSYVGAVGAKLYYPQSKLIQHAGITNLRLGPVHKLQFKEDKRSYYFARNQIAMNVLAVTGACLMVRKSVFAKAGGFDEQFQVAFNDVEFCFRLYESGYQNVVRNDIHLWHYESFSRGNDETREKQQRLAGERELLYQKHPELYANDPYYHPYLCNDILDTNYSCAYQYESGRSANQQTPVFMKQSLKPTWENECLIVSMEYAGSLEKWISQKEPEGSGIYFQGYAFVTGSDNACYKRFLLLQHTESGDVYTLFCDDVFRPDLELNLDEKEQALLCGFSIVMDKNSLPKGEYRVGVLAKDCCSRQRLYQFTGKYVTI